MNTFFIAAIVALAAGAVPAAVRTAKLTSAFRDEDAEALSRARAMAGISKISAAAGAAAAVAFLLCGIFL